MARTRRLLFSFLLTLSILISINSQTTPDNLDYEVIGPTTSGSFTYETESAKPAQLQKYYKEKVGTLPDLKKLITDNPAFVALLKKSKQSPKLELKLLQWAELVGEVSAIDDQIRSYVNSIEKLEAFTLEEYVEWCLSHDPGAIQGLMRKIHALVVPVFKEYGLLQLAHEFMSEDSKVCQLQMSPHQLLYSIYQTIALTEIKGYAIMQFSWKLLKTYGRGTFTQEENLARQKYVDRTTQAAAAAQSVLLRADRDLYACAPTGSSSYAEVTKLLQGYIENEVDMNSDGTCRNTCVEYSNTRNYGCYDDEYCARQPRCNGRIYGCHFVDSDMTVCPASSYSFRRYEWIKYESGKQFGQRNYCSLGTSEVESWHRWFVHCSYCMCLCDDPSYNSHRYFSLREAVSDVRDNKVVTGIRLVKHKRVFHIELHQGALGERGSVNASKLVPLQTFDPDGWHVSSRDYHQLSYNQRAINLDDLESPDGYVLTGARFRTVGNHLQFDIRSTPFNFTTGKLFPEKSFWSSKTNDYRPEVYIGSPDIPSRETVPDKIGSQSYQYLQFTHTDFNKDAAQTTVPFVEVQTVLPSKALETTGPTLNSGAGLYHRAASWGSGGYIGLRLRTYNYAAHVHAEPPPTDTPVSN